MAASIQRVYITEGDLLPAIEATITRESTGSAYDLTGHTNIKFSMTRRGSNTAKVNATATVYGTPTNGVLRYAWSGTDTDTPGIYDGQFHADDASGNPVSFPNGAYFEIHVIKRV